jgi:heat shock protein HspQ
MKSRFKVGDRVWDKETDLRGTVVHVNPSLETIIIDELEGPDTNWAKDQHGYHFKARHFQLDYVYAAQQQFDKELEELLSDSK